MKNEIVRAKCVDMSVEGEGIAKANGLVIFVKGMIVDEIADIKIIADKKNYAYGIIDKMISPSPYRVVLDCPISYKCGGCDYRYIDYKYQLIIKKNILINTFKGHNVLDVIEDDNPFYYRNKVQIPVKDHRMGFYRKYSNDIVCFDDCLIESKVANKIINDLKIKLIESKNDKYIRHILIKHAQGTDEIMIGFIVTTFNVNFDEVFDFLINKYSNIKSIILNLNTTNSNVVLGTDEKVVFGNNYINDIYDGIKVKLSLKAFYQVNYNQMLRLYSLIKELADVDSTNEVLDLYCGIGTITLYLARYVKHIIGIEIVPEAIDNAKENAKLNNICNADFVLADASKDMEQYIKDKDLVIVDPPRKGISRDLIQTFKKLKTNKIIYVSCNPATLSRDLNLLEDEYEFSDIHPIDMFPYTTHVECVVKIQRYNN